MPTIHRLKVTLNYVKPPVWRRIEVDSERFDAREATEAMQSPRSQLSEPW